MSILRYKFQSDQDYKKAYNLLKNAIKEIGTSHFDFGGTPADKEIRIINPKNAEIIEALFKKNNLKFEKEEDATSWIGPESFKCSYSDVLRRLSKSLYLTKN
jgi:hypothetical protein